MARNLLILLFVVLITIMLGFFYVYGQAQAHITDTANFIKHLMDQNADGKVSKIEYERFFPYSDGNKDNYLTREEIYGALTKKKVKIPSIAEMTDLLMQFLDVNEDTKVSEVEYMVFLSRTDQNADSFLTQNELYEFAKKLLHTAGPKEGSIAPDFSLKTTNNAIFKLSDLKGKTTVVLIFGSCNSLKSHAAELNGVYQTYKEKSLWYMVYIREANSENGTKPASDRTIAEKAKTMEERIALASACQKDLGLDFPVLVDDINNKVEKAYAAWPERIYVVDKKGNIGYKSEPGDSFDSRILGQSLRKICFT